LESQEKGDWDVQEVSVLDFIEISNKTGRSKSDSESTK
jgi:hypothetical protein